MKNDNSNTIQKSRFWKITPIESSFCPFSGDHGPQKLTNDNVSKIAPQARNFLISL